MSHSSFLNAFIYSQFYPCVLEYPCPPTPSYGAKNRDVPNFLTNITMPTNICLAMPKAYTPGHIPKAHVNTERIYPQSSNTWRSLLCLPALSYLPESLIMIPVFHARISSHLAYLRGPPKKSKRIVSLIFFKNKIQFHQRKVKFSSSSAWVLVTSRTNNSLTC